MGKKRPGQWIGGGQNIEPETQGSTAVSEVIQMIPGQAIATVLGERTKLMVEAIYLHFSIHRLLINEVDALGFLVWVAQLQEAGNSPVQVLDALDTSDRVYSNKAIMMMAPLPFPGVNASGDLITNQITQEGMVAHHEFQASRKIDRSSEVLCLTVQSDVSVVFSVFCQWRAWVTW